MQELSPYIICGDEGYERIYLEHHNIIGTGFVINICKPLYIQRKKEGQSLHRMPYGGKMSEKEYMLRKQKQQFDMIFLQIG